MNLHVMILLEPANTTITHFNVEIKRRTISLTGFWETSIWPTFGQTQSPAIRAAKRDCDWLLISGITPQV
jgi:hypothetical protein